MVLLPKGSTDQGLSAGSACIPPVSTSEPPLTGWVTSAKLPALSVTQCPCLQNESHPTTHTPRRGYKD